MPEPTKAQKKVVKKLREVYGRSHVTEHAADAATGNMRVELRALAGVWNWYYSPEGDYIGGSLTQRLFTPDPPKHIPGNALDN